MEDAGSKIERVIEAKDSKGFELPRGRGRPRRQAFVKMETVPVDRPTLPDPRWMAEFVAVFIKASR